MQLAFTLSMPGCPSWNGRWSGEGRKYVIVRNFTSKASQALAERILKGSRYHYSWSDGWRAGIDVHRVDSKQASKLRKESNGFCGYDWMVESIIKYGKPMADHEVKKHLEEQQFQSDLLNMVPVSVLDGCRSLDSLIKE